MAAEASKHSMSSTTTLVHGDPTGDSPRLSPTALLSALRAFRDGDFGVRLPSNFTGIEGEIADAFNACIAHDAQLSEELGRISEVVGREGLISKRASSNGARGAWRGCIESVNRLIDDLAFPMSEAGRVLGAVSNGDLTQRMPLEAQGHPLKGEFLRSSRTINTMVDRLGAFASEVTRVAREVGSEGKLGGQAIAKGVAGTWKDLTDSVNTMAGNLTAQVRNIAEVTTAVANGDLSKKITVEARGEIRELKGTINTMVDQLNGFASEVTRVAREVGSEGILGGQARVAGVAGTWKDLTDSVNTMAGNLTAQVRNIAEVTTAVARGDLSKKITVDVRGEILELKDTVNTMVDQLNAFASEVTRVAREVGSEGKLGGQAAVEGVAGTWKDLTDSVNSMAGNLTAQVRNIAEVTTAVARGDLSKKITVDVRGEILEVKDTVNVMVDQLNAFASEVTRVAREVGSEGILGGQADVRGVSGTWKDLTDSVNFMAANLTSQVRNIADVTTAVANGDLSKKITVNVRGEIAELKNTINTMVDQLNAFASEVTRVAREVGSEGKLGGQAEVKGVSGTWKDLTDSVNVMASNLTSQVRNIADVTTAVANGDLSRKITVDVRGEILELKNTINTMVDQLNAFASEVTRVAREVGSEGKLGGQAEVKGVSGTWKDLTDSVNVMASNLTSQVRNIADVTTAVAKGDLSRKITVDVRGEIAELKDTINTMVDQLNAFASEVTRVAREVGSDGMLGGQAQVAGVSGTWKDLTDSVNVMASNLTSQVRNIAKVTIAVANGDLSKKITVDVRGEIAELKDTINTMVDQLNAFASEVTRVAREVGSDGVLGGQAHVQGVSGVWKDLTDNVNFMAANLTNQVRGIAEIVTGVANGDLKRKLTLQARGEIAQLAETINEMIDTLATFADQVTTVAREVGFEGKLGGQAEVPSAAGLWRELTDNVNRLAAQLTNQIRAISEVSTAVTKGDLSRTIDIEARGEVGELTRTVNEMIRNLRDTTRKNTEQDWFKTNLARFTAMLQGQRDIRVVTQLVMSELAPLIGVQAGAFYIADASEGSPQLRLIASYALPKELRERETIPFGEGLVGQCAIEGRRIAMSDVPSGYLRIASGLGSMNATQLVVLPVLFEGEIRAVIELASYERFSEIHLLFLDQLMQSIGIMLNTITASMRTEELLEQSQSLTGELQSQQLELKQTNDELEEKARLLQERNAEVERRTREIEEARIELEKKAEQLALTSKYKSQFLANMSHELRTPLNSLLILSKQLAVNSEGNMTPEQVEFAQTIRSAGSDLLTLINDILDLSKIESGTTAIDLQEATIASIEGEVRRTFDQIAIDKNLAFVVTHDEDVPESIVTDPTRLQQILKNLLSNAFKFTSTGSVSLHIGMAYDRALVVPGAAIAFSVRDTGVGIASDKFNVIFEAFQQADMGTSRKFGGTGLGLAISREIAGLLGGEIGIESELGAGSTFTLYHPVQRPSAQQRPTASFVAQRVAEAQEPARDDREVITADDRTLLVVEDDRTFSSLVMRFARERGFKTLAAHSGHEAVELANRYVPDAITLDISLPDVDGWQLLGELKRSPVTAHIPVHVISGGEFEERALQAGAVAFLKKPVSEEALIGTFDQLLGYAENRGKNVLVVEDDLTQLNAMVGLIGTGEMSVKAVTSAQAALAAAGETAFDCIVIDLGLPDVDGERLIEELRSRPASSRVPIIVYTARDLRRDEQARLQRLSSTVVVKDGSAPERLLDELNFFLHRVEAELGGAKRRPTPARGGAQVLQGKRLLVVDDDTRNIFALETALRSYGMHVVSAESGREGIAVLHGRDDIDLILMDIMMPEMDGYETTRRIRADERFANIPIIALTAKAMKGDRDACIAAGASDYVSKPVDIEQLTSLFTLWLSG
jgi:HAMP domain-containing protein/CheY-like chemotaxis protein/putative methionine-R-sulfoxide reductase with GAF domain